MKKFTEIVAVAVLTAAILASCKNTPATAPAFYTMEKEQNFAATGNFEVAYRFEYLSALADETVLQKVQLGMVAEFFGPEFVRTDAATSAAAFDGFLTEEYGIRKGSAEFRRDGCLHLKSTAKLVGDHIVAYTVDHVLDVGGAHPMEETRHANWDLRTGARLTLDDIFTPEGRAALGEIIRAQILKDKGTASWEELMTANCYNPAAEVAANDNFTLTATEVTFTYNPYEIACYATGDTRVTLPLANLAGFKKEIFE